jgi:hypothetical protein
VCGGVHNTATGNLSFAFGYGAYTDIDSTAVFDWGPGKGTVFIGKDADSSAYRLYVNGYAYAAGDWLASDRDFKTDIRPINEPLEVVSNLNPVRFAWRDGLKEYGIECDREDVGFIAQELQQVLPELVREGADRDHLAVNYDHITAVNTAAIQELIRVVDELRGENDALKTQNESLQERIGILERK